MDQLRRRRSKFQKPREREGPVGLRRGGLLAAGSVAASASTTLCSVGATILILRLLNPSEAGRFAFLVELLYSVGLLGSLGQSVLQSRLYQQAPPGHYDWRRDVWSTIWITAPFVFAGVMALAVPYEVTAFQIAFLCLGAEAFVLVNCFSAVLGQQQFYAWSGALLRMGNAMLIFPALLMLIQPSLRQLNFVLLSLLVFLGTTALLGGILLARRLTPGRNQISLRQRATGLIFLASILALLVPQRGQIVVAGAMLSAEKVAALAALASILRVFDLVGEPAGRVFSTEMARHPRAVSPGLLFAPWLLAGLLSAALLVALPPVAHYFYAGRYDSALGLLGWLVLAGALRFVEIVPRGFLAYLAPARSFNFYAAAHCGWAVAGLVLMVKWTGDSGLHGTVVAGALIAAGRVAISYLFYATVPRLTTGSAIAGEGVVVKAFETGGEESPV
jgi:hypothetical protein